MPEYKELRVISIYMYISKLYEIELQQPAKDTRFRIKHVMTYPYLLVVGKQLKIIKTNFQTNCLYNPKNR